MLRKFAAFFALAPLVMLAFSRPAHADSLFSSLGDGKAYDGTSGWDVGVSNSVNYDEAMSFTVNGTGSFDVNEIDVALTNVSGSNGAVVELFTDSSGLPGSLIPGATWTLSDLPTFQSVSSIQPSQTISGITGITLTGGTTYFLAAFPSDGTTSDIWDTSNRGNGTLIDYSTDGGATWSPNPAAILFPAGAFAVFGTAASASMPEPSSLPLLATALLALLPVFSYRTRKESFHA